MNSVLRSFALFFALLNPFLLGVYMLDALRELSPAAFRRMIANGALVSLAIFSAFVVAGDSIFGSVLPARFASFQIFGGIVFLLMGIRYVLAGAAAIASFRGPARAEPGAEAFLYFVGPGTVSASVVVGGRHSISVALMIVAASVVLAVLCMGIVKFGFDRARAVRGSALDRELEILGRIAGLLVGTFAVDMILTGVSTFLAELPTH